MTEDRRDWIPYLPDPSAWPEELADVVARGYYMRWNHSDDWIILMSTLDGDMVRVQCGGTIQARLAVNRSTGEVVNPTPGVSIGKWEAEIYGKAYKSEQRWRMSEWDRGTPVRGIPRDTKGQAGRSHPSN